MAYFEKDLLNRIEYTLSNKNVEFEVVFGGYSFDVILKIMKRLKSLNYKLVEDEVLDIFVDNSSLRVSLNKPQMLQFCKTNILKQDNIHEIIEKRDQKNTLYNQGYNFRVNVKSEEDMSKTEHPDKQKFFNSELFTIQNKTYRLKKRYSFYTNDNNFKIDLTIVKEYKGDETIINSGLLNKDEFYEIEIEYIGKLANKKENALTFKKQLKKNIGYILQIIQDSFYICNIREQKDVKYIFRRYLTSLRNKRKTAMIKAIDNFIDYLNSPNLGDKQTVEVYLVKKPKYITDLYYNVKNLIDEEDLKTVLLDKLEHSKTFINQEKKHIYNIGPKPSTLEINNLYEDELTHILKDYTVTDKAEGEGKILYVLGLNHLDEREQKRFKRLIGKTYMIDAQKTIYTGLKQPSLENSIINGEYMKLDKKGNYINRYLAYDIYVVRDKDVSNLPLLNDDICRYNILKEDFTSNFKLRKEIKFDFVVKEFYNTNETQSIFDLSKVVLEKEHDYKLDGLIYTPALTPVGYDPEPFRHLEDVKMNMYNLKMSNTWFSNLKWKPSHDNSIDFLIEFKQDEELAKDNIYKDEITVDADDIFKRYKTIHLKNSKQINTYEQGKKVTKYITQLFKPNYHYYDGVNTVKLEIDEQNNILGKWDNMPLRNNTVVEFNYDVETRQWIPLRTRYDKTVIRYDKLAKKYTRMNRPNEFRTCNNVWNSMHNNISTEIIKTGENIPNKEEYYGTKDDGEVRQNSKIIHMRKYHNNVKSKALQQVVSQLREQDPKREISLLELASGRGQDLHKWRIQKINHVVGIELYKTEVHGPNGAEERKQEFKEKNYQYPETIEYLVGDCKYNINDPNSGAYQDEYIEKSKIIKNKFDIVSMQFAMHYFFESKKTIHNILQNINQNLKLNGYFIASCLDGKVIFEKLKGKDEIKTKLWSITKLYKDNDELSETIEDYKSLPISVYVDSLGTIGKEWLVHPSILIEELNKLGIELQEIKSFEKPFYKSLTHKMNKEEQEYSYLNRYYIFKKVFDYNEPVEQDSTDEEGDEMEDKTKSKTDDKSEEKKSKGKEDDKLKEELKDEQVAKKLRICLNSMSKFFSNYEVYLMGKNKMIKDNQSIDSKSKRKKYIWSIFKNELDLESLQLIETCIQDIEMYQMNKEKYRIFDFDLSLLIKYKTYLNDIRNKLEAKDDFKITKEMKIKNMTDIRESYYENLAKLIIECHQDFKKGYTVETLHNSKYYIVIDEFVQFTLEQFKTKYFNKKTNLYKTLEKLINATKMSYKKIVSGFDNFYIMYNELSKMDIIEKSISDKEKYKLIIEKLDKMFEEYKIYECNPKLIDLKSLNIVSKLKYVSESVKFLNNLEGDYIDIEKIDNYNKILFNIQKQYQS